ncbi:ThiF family adenylyltransferase [Chryseobacterium oryctis]|uniref:ThiF family adenylyltransferase n=1 Tax=Chryseobacterium oryctis TaxID=2952618 RepID=A0ABT3HND5_9FLAO|nr:ThiF family adenylyltransferase [Chryseobacterium oryctis]MCW3161306.1 ThiF family adenylyltransferase [Chryseobacterium oryctis]
MLQELINHSPDIHQLMNEGFSLEFKGGYLLIHHIPYVNTLREVKYGTLVSSLTLNGFTTVRPDNHVIQFIGDQPCDIKGIRINAIFHTDTSQDLGNGIVINRAFSNKPPEGYENYYEKFKRYAEIISAPAKSLNDSVTEVPCFPHRNLSENNVFQYVDTNSSRANIGFVNEKLSHLKVGIVGLGGTGAYILDFVAKTGVSEIHLIDNDVFSTHNAFRSPGAASFEELCSEISKVEYYKEKYSNMHRNIRSSKTFLNEENLEILSTLDFVFLCIDRNSARKNIAEYLCANGIAFIDVGLGADLVLDKITAMIRVSSFPVDFKGNLNKFLPFDETTDNAYNSNIQIAELNALNAGLAVIKWKKMYGFYQDLINENHSIYCLNSNQLTDECDFNT